MENCKPYNCIPYNIRNTFRGFYIMNNKVYTKDNLEVAIVTGEIQSEKILCKTKTNDEMKSLFIKSDLVDSILRYTLDSVYSKQHVEVLLECLYSLFGYRVMYEGIELYHSPTVLTLGKLDKTQLNSIGLGLVSDVLIYNIQCMEKFLTKEIVQQPSRFKPRQVKKFTDSLRGISEGDKDLIRLYCFNDRTLTILI